MLCLLAILFEGTVVTVPLIIGLLGSIAVFNKSAAVFLLGFFSGVLVDTVSLHLLNFSSIYFLIFLLLIFLYERKFEVQNMWFVFLATFIGSLGYLGILRYHSFFWVSLINAVLGIGIFFIFRLFQKGVSRGNRITM